MEENNYNELWQIARLFVKWARSEESESERA